MLETLGDAIGLIIGDVGDLVWDVLVVDELLPPMLQDLIYDLKGEW